jgi:hypothetical protein
MHYRPVNHPLLPAIALSATILISVFKASKYHSKFTKQSFEGSHLSTHEVAIGQFLG